MNKFMKKLRKGQKIIDPDRLYPEYGVILEHVESDRSQHLYLIRWSGGHRTLFEVKVKNLLN